jgi:hypothetical protein
VLLELHGRERLNRPGGAGSTVDQNWAKNIDEEGRLVNIVGAAWEFRARPAGDDIEAVDGSFAASAIFFAAAVHPT